MRMRCENPAATNYQNYGARGIRVCDRWQDFHSFASDVGSRPDGHTLDREDVDGDYEPDNCSWATHKAQLRNKRNNRLLMYNGVTQCVTAWAEEVNLNYRTILTRLRRGWSVPDALSPTRR